MKSALSDILTAAQLLRELRISRMQLSYALALGDIQPWRRAGTVRLFVRSQLPEIRAVLRRTGAIGGSCDTGNGEPIPAARGSAE